MTQVLDYLLSRILGVTIVREVPAKIPEHRIRLATLGSERAEYSKWVGGGFK